MPRGLPLIVGSLALVTTVAAVCVQIVLAAHISARSPVRAISIVSAALEWIVLVALGWLWLAYALDRISGPLRRRLGMALGVGIFVCILAAAASAATLVCLSKASPDMGDHVVGVTKTNFLVGSSVAVGLSFPCQLIFLVVHFVAARAAGLDVAHSLHTDYSGRHSPGSQVRTIPYSKTAPSMVQVRTSTESRNPPASLQRKSSMETVGSAASSMSHAVRPMSSRTKLLRPKDKRRPASLDSNACRASLEDSFDSWDTSSVDAANRQMVLEASSPPASKSRLLETIPASPTISRSPSPGDALDLPPPRAARRSRSYSPASRGRASPRPASQRSSTEQHIHPLFRSDSPTPPPAATPGTSVVASPNAGQILAPQPSMRSTRSLQRMRSGSLPTTPSPLSRQGSFETTASSMRRQVDEQGSIEEVDEQSPPQGERKMTPPIPEWILSAGSRTSLTGYNSRRVNTEEDEETGRQA